MATFRPARLAANLIGLSAAIAAASGVSRRRIPFDLVHPVFRPRIVLGAVVASWWIPSSSRSSSFWRSVRLTSVSTTRWHIRSPWVWPRTPDALPRRRKRGRSGFRRESDARRRQRWDLDFSPSAAVVKEIGISQCRSLWSRENTGCCLRVNLDIEGRRAGRR